MSSTAIRAWYCAVGVNCGPGRDVARGPDPLDARPLPLVDDDVAAARSRRRCARAPSASVFGTRPEARRTCDTLSSRPPGSVATVVSPSRANASTPPPSTTSIPSSSSAAWSSSAASVSARAAIWSPLFTIVTREPKRAKICANSSPTGPAPTTSSDSGISSSSSAVTWSIHSICSIPGIGGTAVREPGRDQDRGPPSARGRRRVPSCASTNAASPRTSS